MHEGHFTEEIVKAILTEVKKYPDCRPDAIKVSVGQMFHLVPESVETHFRIMAQGTPLEKTRLLLHEVPVEVECQDCKKIVAVEDHHFLVCSLCGSLDVEIVSGKEIKIDSIHLKES